MRGWLRRRRLRRWARLRESAALARRLDAVGSHQSARFVRERARDRTSCAYCGAPMRRTHISDHSSSYTCPCGYSFGVEVVR